MGEPAVGTVEVFAEVDSGNEGLAFIADSGGQLVLWVGATNALQQIAADGQTSALVDLPGPLGMARHPDGSMIVCGKAEGGAGQGEFPGVLWRVQPDGEKSLFVGPDNFELTNFVAIDRDGSVVFSDSAAERVYHASADGASVSLVTDAISYPNGMAFSPDGATLYVASWDADLVYSLPRTETGFGPPEILVDDVVNVDGIAVFANGDLALVSSGEGVVRWATDGAKTVIAPASEFSLPANGAFGTGGFGANWLYVTNLMGRQVSRVYVGEAGAALPLE